MSKHLWNRFMIFLITNQVMVIFLTWEGGIVVQFVAIVSLIFLCIMFFIKNKEELR